MKQKLIKLGEIDKSTFLMEDFNILSVTDRIGWQKISKDIIDLI